MRLLLVALVTVLTVPACGHEVTSTPALSTTTPTITTPAPSPSPTTLTIAQAAAKYKQIVKPSNDITFGEFRHAQEAYSANPTDATRAALNTATWPWHYELWPKSSGQPRGRRTLRQRWQI